MSGAGASFEEGISKSTPQEWDDEVLFFSRTISLSFHNQTLISELTEKIVQNQRNSPSIPHHRAATPLREEQREESGEYCFHARRPRIF
jgi:hypothetical protein